MDKALLTAGAIGICVCIYLLFFEHDFAGSENSASAIGQVTFKAKDTRQKSSKSFDWGQLKERQNIFVGDSIYSGEESQVEVGMKSGGTVQVGANSLVTFDMIEKDKIIDLELGNFRVKVDGQMKIAVNGKLTVINGKKSEVQVFIGKNKKPQLRLLSGEAKIIRKEKTLELKPQIVVSLPVPDVDDTNLISTVSPPVSEPTREAASTEASATAPVATAPKPQNYIWRLYDLYEIQGRNVKAKYPAPETYELEGQTVTPRLLEESTPSFATSDKIFATDFAGAEQTEKFPLIAPRETMGFIFESSVDKTFTREKTSASWSKSSNLPLRFPSPGIYFYRFRAVSPSQELSPWSKVAQFNVLAPKPVLAKNEPKSKKPGKPLPKKPLSKVAKGPAPVKRDVAAIDPVLSERQPLLTGPSETSSVRLPGIPSTSLQNEKYKASQVALQGLVWTLQSTEQRYANQTAPVATGVGARGLHWYEHHGLEWNVKTGVFPANSTGGEASSLKYLETRYHYRFFSKAPFHFSRELQWSLFGGAEFYRNSGIVTSRKYDLFKYGSSLEFPLWHHWSTGGELVLGNGTDGSRQQQISGNINYFLNPDWSLGVGYRLHMFEAGSAASTPNGILPYREGYTEGTSFLNYYF
jgi:hypothetical protein